MIDLSVLKKDLDGKPVAILGLGKSGLAIYEACKAADIETIIWDSNEEGLEELKAQGANVQNLEEVDFTEVALLCMSPGIPFTHPKPHPAVIKAQEADVEIICDIELLYRACPDAKYVGITGSNGKSTTTALIGHIVKEAGLEVEVGGNIGNAAMTLESLGEGGVYVIELSSYQLDLCKAAPDISAFINISPDHLERHGDIDGYVKAKERIFMGAGTAVVGVDDEYSSAVAERLKEQGNRNLIEVSVNAEGLNIDLSECKTLKGDHNKQNALIALEVCKELGIAYPTIMKALKTFPGLEHRQKLVATVNGVDYINDSKATNDDASAKALSSFGNIYWIAGGQSKNAGYEECKAYFDNVRAGFLIGEAAEEIAKELKSSGIKYTDCKTIDVAIEEAKKAAEEEGFKNPVVLLSPACASWDQFKSFEQRGDVFKEIVKNLT